MATGSVSDRYMNGMDQSKQRGVAVWFDQHKSSSFRNAQGETLFENGRPYHSIVELSTKMPVGPVMPFGWEAPVEVPQQYIIKAIGKVTSLPKSAGPILTNVVTDRIRIDYAQMRLDDDKALRDHWKEAVKVAAARDWPVPKFRAAMDHRLLAIIGPAPRDPRIAEALMGGNEWALGMKMPTRDPVTGQMVVEEDEELARIIMLNRDDVLTPEQVEREEAAREVLASSSVTDETRALLAEAKRLFAEAKAMREEAEAKHEQEPEKPKNKGGRPRKVVAPPLTPAIAG